MRLAKEAWPFFTPFAAAALVLALLRQPWWAAAALGAGLLVLLFFRDPARRFDGDVEVVLAAADGVVTGIETVEDPLVGPGPRHRVATFLSVFDVHVQRAPIAGTVVKSHGAKGRKVAAFRPDAATVNESHLTVLRGEQGEIVGVRQIAGLLARRVVPYLSLGDTVRRGDHLGLIKFGSRVDVLVPPSYRILVDVGARLRAGETPLAIPEVAGKSVTVPRTNDDGAGSRPSPP
jgi:phosphatidylserine decarboxylase